MKKPPRPALPTDKVRFVGDPIACVVARDAAAGQGRRRGDRGRHRAAAGRDQAGAGGGARARPRSSTTCRATSRSISTTATARRSPPRSRGAAHKVKLKLRNTRMIVNTIEPRAAIGSYDTAKERFTLHSCSQGVMGLKAGLVNVHEGRARQDARRHRQRRRLVRHEGAGLSGIRLHPARRARARPPGEVDRRALDQLRLRQPRPRPRADRRARARRRRPFPRAAAGGLRQSRRLPGRHVAAAADAQHRAQRHQPLPHAADGSLDQVRVHQHHLRQPLPRRRPARGQLLHGAADRLRRRRNRLRPHRAAPQEPDPQERHSLEGRLRRDLRQRRLPGDPQAGARGLRLEGLQQAQAREQEARQAARHRRRLLSRSHRARQQGDGRHLPSTPTAASPSAPARSTTARATPRRSRRC